MLNQILEITYNSMPLHISLKVQRGRGDLLFFIHGLGCAKESFKEIWRYEWFRPYTVVTFDLAGFGDSSKPEKFLYRLEDHARICSQILSHYPHEKVHIIGHSMGGAIGLLVASDHADRLISFVNVEGNLIGRDCSISRHPSSIPYKEFLQYQLPLMILTTARSAEPGSRLWSAFIKKSSPEAFYKSSQSLVHWSDSGKLLQLFKNLQCRKAYVLGDRNSHLAVLEMLNGIEKVSIPGSGHFPMNDNPDSFYRKLRDIIKGASTN